MVMVLLLPSHSTPTTEIHYGSNPLPPRILHVSISPTVTLLWDSQEIYTSLMARVWRPQAGADPGTSS